MGGTFLCILLLAFRRLRGLLDGFGLRRGLRFGIGGDRRFV
jgi:hypothetical protein